MQCVFPGKEWDWADPKDSGFDATRLEEARQWLVNEAGEQLYRIVVVRHGRIVAEWQQGVETETRLNLASATKSSFSSMLGIAIDEGRIASADDRLISYFPQFMDVPEGRGPKPGRHAKPEDKDITFRQLISNTSGYMKPGETPGMQFHYQTFGMNVLCHGIESAYGVYDAENPDALPGIGMLIEEKIRNKIGAGWAYRYTDFKHPPDALVNIFGHSPRIDSSCRDLARAGLLWLHFGRWDEEQVIPEAWMREATVTAPEIREHCPREEWCYGYAFWTNDHARLWPSLPRDSFAASGAGRKHCWVAPSLDLVVAQCPGLCDEQRHNAGVLGRIVLAIVDGPRRE